MPRRKRCTHDALLGVYLSGSFEQDPSEDEMNAVGSPRIYLDYNASTPLAPEVADAIARSSKQPFGNPSSQHWAGLPAHEAVERARRQVASLLRCSSDEIVFTSGGSEANNHALKGVYLLTAEKPTSSRRRSSIQRSSTPASS